MSAAVVILPAIAKPQAVGGLDVVTLPVRLSRRVYDRLLKIANGWDVPPGAAAEDLLIRAINEAAGVRKR